MISAGAVSVPVLICSNDVPVSAHTFTITLTTTDPENDPLLTSSSDEITLDSQVLCAMIEIDASNSAAVVDSSAVLMIESASDMYSTFSTTVSVVEAEGFDLIDSWAVSDVT